MARAGERVFAPQRNLPYLARIHLPLEDSMNVLVTDGISEEGARVLRDAGLNVDVLSLKPEQLLEKICAYECIVVRSATKVTRALIDAGTRLKVIARGGVGVDNIDVEHAAAKGIMVLNTPAASAISVAELVIGHMLAVSRFLHLSTMEMRQGKWPKKEYSKGIELYGKTLGIIGLGNIGKEVARRALGLGMKVLAYDPPFAPMEFIVEITTREKLLSTSDFITLHIPLDKLRAHAIGRHEFELMKDGVVLVNCARGGVVDEAALLENLNSGKVGGAGIDVFEHEPPDDTTRLLINHPRVSVSPHIGGSTVEAQARVGTEIALKVVKALGAERRS
jgi:D-3-phosphoglycerate dehydrogenase